MSRRILLPAAVIGAALLTACAMASDTRSPLQSAANVDLPRFMGAWHVIARVDYFGERGDVASQDVYRLNDEGQVDTVYRYRKSFGADDKEKTLGSVGLVQPGTNNAFWRIRFFGLLKADYLILETAPDYSWALIGQPSRKLGWVFAREPVMDDGQYAELQAKMVAYGYDPTTLLRVAQVPEQVGRPGFHP
jgi:apolipoprotein D and lipocalin family protein